MKGKLSKTTPVNVDKSSLYKKISKDKKVQKQTETIMSLRPESITQSFIKETKVNDFLKHLLTIIKKKLTKHLKRSLW